MGLFRISAKFHCGWHVNRFSRIVVRTQTTPEQMPPPNKKPKGDEDFSLEAAPDRRTARIVDWGSDASTVAFAEGEGVAHYPNAPAHDPPLASTVAMSVEQSMTSNGETQPFPGSAGGSAGGGAVAAAAPMPSGQPGLVGYLAQINPPDVPNWPTASVAIPQCGGAVLAGSLDLSKSLPTEQSMLIAQGAHSEPTSHPPVQL